MDHNFGCAFTRQNPVETDARSSSSKWFALPRHKPINARSCRVRLKTRGTAPKAGPSGRDLNMGYRCERAAVHGNLLKLRDTDGNQKRFW